MAYRCECGNREAFLEVFDEAVDVVDATAAFMETKTRNVAFYMCPECHRQIGYREFLSLALETAAHRSD